MSGWPLMVMLALAVFAACKLATLRSARQPASAGRRLAYLALWPGMDAAVFCGHGPASQQGLPRASEWVRAAVTCAAGAATVALAAGPLATWPSWPRGVVAIAGFAMLLHFGAFVLVSLAWRSAGVDATEIMAAPWNATSLSDFWGRRWNVAFHALARDLVFRPLRRARVGASMALLATFVASGLVHELVISLPARGGWGLPTLYFALQGAGVLAERTWARRASGRVFALGVVLLPAPLLFHPPFLERVICPLLDALARGVRP